MEDYTELIDFNFPEELTSAGVMRQQQSYLVGIKRFCFNLLLPKQTQMVMVTPTECAVSCAVRPLNKEKRNKENAQAERKQIGLFPCYRP